MALSRALIASALLHVLIGGACLLSGGAVAASARARAPERVERELGALSGDTVDVDAVVEAAGSGRRSEAAGATPPPAEATPPPAGATPPPAEATPEETAARRAAEIRKQRAEQRRRRAEREQRAAEAESQRAARVATETPESAPDAGAGASYGGAGLPPGVRHLPAAFTQAIAAATNRDPLWHTLALGDVGGVSIALELDADGRLTGSIAGAEPDDVPAPLRRLVERTLLLLRAGRFALDTRGVQAGTQRLRVEVTLSTVPPPEGDWDEPHHTAAMGFQPPAPGAPGRAYFVHASGRRFDARVTIER